MIDSSIVGMSMVVEALRHEAEKSQRLQTSRRTSEVTSHKSPEYWRPS